MYTHESEAFFDVYPFVNSVEELPSARVSLHKPSGRVTFQGDTYTREQVQDLVAAFNAAFNFIEECPQPCPDCDDCARDAYSDATTAGFFYGKCEKHREG